MKMESLCLYIKLCLDGQKIYVALTCTNIVEKQFYVVAVLPRKLSLLRSCFFYVTFSENFNGEKMVSKFKVERKEYFVKPIVAR